MTRALVPYLLVTLLIAGCLGDDRCPEGADLVGARCVAIADAGPEAAVDQEVADSSSKDGASDAPACAAMTSEQLIGTFAQQGTVAGSDCDPPFPRDGLAFDAEVVISEGNDGSLAVVINGLATLEGSAAVETDGSVRIEATGSLMNLTLSMVERICFDSADSATLQVEVTLANAAGAICGFETPGTFKRKN